MYCVYCFTWFFLAFHSGSCSILLWTSAHTQVPALKSFSSNEFNNILRDSHVTVLPVAFKSKSLDIAHQINEILSNATTTYIVNSNIEFESEKVLELTGDQIMDLNIINEALKENHSENAFKGVVVLIVEDSIRVKRKADSDPSEAPYAEPSGAPILYSAVSRANKNIEAMVYSSQPPLLETNNSSRQLGEAVITNMDIRDTYTRLIATIPVDIGKITLRFRFSWVNGYWYLSSVEVEFVGEHAKQFNLTTNQSISASQRFSYHCGGQSVFVDAENDIKLYLYDIQAQPDAFRHKFSDDYNCVPFTTAPLWSGLMVVFLLLIGLAIGLSAIGNIKTMDKFDNQKTKQLSITVFD